MLLIRFPDELNQQRGQSCLTGRFPFKTSADGMMVPDAALSFLRHEGIPFDVQGPAPFEEWADATCRGDEPLCWDEPWVRPTRSVRIWRVWKRLIVACFDFVLDANRLAWVWRWSKRAAVGIVLLLLAALGSWYGWRWNYAKNAERQYQAVVAELDATDPGWRLDEIEAAREEVPDEENSARVVVSACASLPPKWLERPPRQNPLIYTPAPLFPDGDDLHPPTPLLDKLEAFAPDERYDGELARELLFELEKVETARLEARRLADRPRGRHRIAYSPDVLSTSLQDQIKSREAARLLALDAAALAHGGWPDDAVASCRGAVNAGRSLGEPLLIAMLIRIACVNEGERALERVLAQSQPTDAALQKMQALLADEDRQPLFLYGLRGERALQHHMMSNLETGTVRLQTFLRHAPASFDYSPFDVFLLGPGFLRANHAWVLKHSTELLEAARTTEGDNLEHPMAELEARLKFSGEIRRDSILARLMVPGVEKVAVTQQRHRALLRCSMTAMAAERFRLRHRRWPETLDEMVADKLLAAVPLDPFDGAPLRLLRDEEGIRIYSCGPDRRDDGGFRIRWRPDDPGDDLGFQLWEVRWRGRVMDEKAPPEPELLD